MMKFVTTTFLAVMAVIVSSCGLAEKKAKLPPLPLFNEEIRVNKIWSTSFGSDKHNIFPGLKPAVDDGTAYAASPNGKIAAIDIASGKSVWQYSHKKTKLSGGPGAGEGIAAVGDHDGRVHAHGSDGSLLWSVQLSSEILAAPAVGYGQVVVRSADGQLFGLSASNGQNLWAHSTALPVLTLRGSSAPVIAGNTVIVGFDDGSLIIIDLDSGGILWEQRFGSEGGGTELERVADIDGTPLVIGNNVWLASYQGKVSMANTVTGRVIWDYQASTKNELAADDKALYVVDDEGVLTALDLVTGEFIWRQEALRNQFLSGVAVAGDYIACGDSKGYVHWLARADGRLVGRNKLSGAITSTPLSFGGDTIIVYTRSGALAALRPEPLAKP